MGARQTNLLQGTLDLLILKALAAGEMHGLGVSRAHRADHAGHVPRKTGMDAVRDGDEPRTGRKSGVNLRGEPRG